VHPIPSRARRRRGAFTLVELAIVVVIIGALGAIAVPFYRGYRERAMITQAIVDIGHISTAIEIEVFENRRVPDSIAHLPEAQILDPWGNPYVYLNVSDSAPPSVRGNARKDKSLAPINSDYDLYSVGKDGDTMPPLTNPVSHDDIVRAGDGTFVGLAKDF